MAKGDQNGVPNNKRSGMSPFIFTPEEFPEDTATQNIETTENGSKLKSKKHVLIGDEVPEQLMIQLKTSKTRSSRILPYLCQQN